ncbi:hypothetical protein BSKO_02393 [Bryopsis sp. KO-2023]|nr:hypothetical protein BSKO_02393 [Bryopsis sp. KO-2023]
MSPFRFLTGEDVSAPFTKGLGVVLAKAGCSRFRAETSEAMLNRMRDEFRWAQSNLEAARARVAYYADQGRSEETFSVGQKVLVKASVVRGRLQASTDKLGAKFYGPVPIVQVLSDVVYKVKFPPQVKVPLDVMVWLRVCSRENRKGRSPGTRCKLHNMILLSIK